MESCHQTERDSRDATAADEAPRQFEPAQTLDMQTLDTQGLTWAALLQQWVGLAQSALALGDDPQSLALRAMVPDIIMMQAVTCALAELGKLPAAEQRLGCFRAQWLVDRHAQAMREAWPDEAFPEKLEELIADARQAHEQAEARLAAVTRSCGEMRSGETKPGETKRVGTKSDEQTHEDTPRQDTPEQDAPKRGEAGDDDAAARGDVCAGGDAGAVG